MEKNDDQTEDDLAAIQKVMEIAAATVTHHTKAEKEKTMQNTPEVRVREEAAARCTAKSKRKTAKFWRDHISDKNGRRDNLPPNAQAVPKTAFSHAMTVMDKVKGWNEESWVGSKFAACACGITLKPHCVMDSDGNMKTEGRCS